MVAGSRQIDGRHPIYEICPVHELYVPWWAWPFELIHRAIFGQVKLKGIDVPVDGVTREFHLDKS